MKALFLDRDGVINIDYGYVHKIENFDFNHGIFDLCKTAIENGYIIIVVTNQSGIGCGYYTEEDFHTLTKWMERQFAINNCLITEVYYCPYHEEKGLGDYKKKSEDRKPSPGMILKAAEKYDIDLSRSLLIGDRETDIEAAIAAGIGKQVMFPKETGETKASHIIYNLNEAIGLL